MLCPRLLKELRLYQGSGLATPANYSARAGGPDQAMQPSHVNRAINERQWLGGKG